ncbi:MAG: hypothetical protein HQ530_02865 [Parcubacteria group bacterium]|nr:hypothetical protein [Parcubacteria group bacterium]
MLKIDRKKAEHKGFGPSLQFRDESGKRVVTLVFAADERGSREDIAEVIAALQREYSVDAPTQLESARPTAEFPPAAIDELVGATSKAGRLILPDTEPSQPVADQPRNAKSDRDPTGSPVAGPFAKTEGDHDIPALPEEEELDDEDDNPIKRVPTEEIPAGTRKSELPAPVVAEPEPPAEEPSKEGKGPESEE